jgi:Transposase IS4
MRFDDRSTRSPHDRLAHIREVFSIFTRNCQAVYSPGEVLTVDESLVGFRGRCKFKMFIPSKPKKFGLKIWSMVDVSNMYLCNAAVYLGKGQGQGVDDVGDPIYTSSILL